eukprot:CAMPEP_0119500002 /NCGR_PEP_ID=MMETSP1344-20130328/22283_1 /TAXON_ID=236787 /ORGANISM="Florenciella parvula, Strain CCMP2471" /LENGTH=177 /DNA_ID=CAMNT_0007536055 /DNA_START=278 /DNA_END=811 /DNA_ORIENTATION=-
MCDARRKRMLLTRSTFVRSFAETSTKNRSGIVSGEGSTTRSEIASTLHPTIILKLSGERPFATGYQRRMASSNEARSVTSYTSNVQNASAITDARLLSSVKPLGHSTNLTCSSFGLVEEAAFSWCVFAMDASFENGFVVHEASCGKSPSAKRSSSAVFPAPLAPSTQIFTNGATSLI